MAMDPDVTEPSPAEAPATPGRLEDLYVRNAPGALRLAYFLTGNRELAEDLVQEAFVRVAGRFRHLRVPDAFDAYLRRTIVNLSTSQLRRTKLERAYVARHGVEPAIAQEPERPRRSRRALAGVAHVAGAPTRRDRPPVLRRPLRDSSPRRSSIAPPAR